MTLGSERAALAVLGVAEEAGDEVVPAALACLVAAEGRGEPDVSKPEEACVVLVLHELEARCQDLARLRSPSSAGPAEALAEVAVAGESQVGGLTGEVVLAFLEATVPFLRWFGKA